MFPQTDITAKKPWICSSKRELEFDVLAILSSHVETVVLMSNVKNEKT